MALLGLLLLCGVASWAGVNGEPCTITGTACQCALSDGRTMDITGITTSPVFQNFPDKDGQGYQYAYGPCQDVLNLGDDCVPSNDAATCQNAGQWYNLGRTQQLSIDVDTSASQVKSTWVYTGGSDGRQTTVVITCDPSQTPGTISDEGEHPELNYNFAVTSSYGCLSGGGPGNQTTHPVPPVTTTQPVPPVTTTQPVPPVTTTQPVPPATTSHGYLPVEVSLLAIFVILGVMLLLIALLVVLQVVVIQRLGPRKLSKGNYHVLSVHESSDDEP